MMIFFITKNALQALDLASTRDIAALVLCFPVQART
jgi:hypothetical protein